MRRFNAMRPVLRTLSPMLVRIVEIQTLAAADQPHCWLLQHRRIRMQLLFDKRYLSTDRSTSGASKNRPRLPKCLPLKCASALRPSMLVDTVPLAPIFSKRGLGRFPLHYSYYQRFPRSAEGCAKIHMRLRLQTSS